MSPAARWAGIAAVVLGFGHALVSAYWALGGTGLLDTVGGQLEDLGRGGGLVVKLALWAVVAAKLVAAVLPWLAATTSGRWRRVLRALTWVETVVLVGYGGVLTMVGLAVQAGLVATGPGADHHALAWHAFFWDPWFLLWGLAALVVLLATRTARRPGVG